MTGVANEVKKVETNLTQRRVDLHQHRARLNLSILEIAAAVEEHRRGWQHLSSSRREAAEHESADRTRQQIDTLRRREAYYLGQAVALAWVAHWFDSALQCHGDADGGGIFSCPWAPPMSGLDEHDPDPKAPSLYTEGWGQPLRE